MIECPKCRMAFERQVKFCNRCGYQFTGLGRRGSVKATMFVIMAGLMLIMIVLVAASGGAKHEANAGPTRVPAARQIGDTLTLTRSVVCSPTRNGLLKVMAHLKDTDLAAKLMIQTQTKILNPGQNITLREPLKLYIIEAPDVSQLLWRVDSPSSCWLLDSNL